VGTCAHTKHSQSSTKVKQDKTFAKETSQTPYLLDYQLTSTPAANKYQLEQVLGRAIDVGKRNASELPKSEVKVNE
jgi:hypothetical protein